MPLKIKTLKLFLLENKTPTAITTTHTLLKNDPQDWFYVSLEALSW